MNKQRANLFEKNRINKKNILKNRSEFSDVIQNGNIFKSKFFVLALKENHHLRFGFTTKGGLKKVDRNRLRRISREIWRRHYFNYELRGSLVIMIRENAMGQSYTSIENDFLQLLAKIAARRDAKKPSKAT